MYCLSDLLQLVVSERAQALQITPGKPPGVQVQGSWVLVDGPIVSVEEASDFLNTIASKEQLRELDRCGDVRFSFAFGDLARFAISARISNREITVEFRNLSA